MFESHFGLSGPPFQLNADPAFFFGSRGHSHALAYMRFGVHQAEGFIVVTGEIGAGKTTLVRTLMASLEQDRVVAAQVVSTQLEAGDLLRAILAAFGVAAPPTASKAHLISSLEAYLTALAAQGRRALLVIDEAQNLNREAVEELRMLSNFQLGTHGLLQSFLVGQPELRQLLQSRSMEQLRQRVIASCHLGPLDDVETRAYIEHRLRHVGWIDRPHFEDEAFLQIHRWTGGIPRRINRLCSRLLLGAYLAGNEKVSAEDVERTAQDLGSEIGEAEPVFQDTPARPTSAGPQDAAATAKQVSGEVIESVSRGAAAQRGAVFCWVDTLADYLKAGVLAQAMSSVPGMPGLVAVHGGRLDELLASLGDRGYLPRPDVEIGLCAHAPDTDRSARLVTALQRFATLMGQYSPSALIALGNGDDALLCSMLANKAGVPLIRTHAGRSQRIYGETQQVNATLLDRIAEILYADSLVTYHALHKAGTAPERLQCVGDLTVDVLHRAEPRLATTEDALSAIGPAAQRLQRGQGYGLVALQFDAKHAVTGEIERIVAALAKCAAELPLLWLADEAALESLASTGSEQFLRSTNVMVVPAPGYLLFLALLRNAELLVTGQPPRFLDEASVLSVPCVLAGREGAMPLRVGDTEQVRAWHGIDDLGRLAHELRTPREGRSDRLQAWDGGAAPRISTHLRAWLDSRLAMSAATGGSAEAWLARRT